MVRSLRVLALCATLVLVSSAVWALCPGQCLSPHNCAPGDPGASGGCTYKINFPHFCYEYQCLSSLAAFDGGLGEPAMCDNERLLLEVLADVPADAGADETIAALERAAQRDPAVRRLVDGMRILGAEGEVFRGPRHGQPPETRQIADAGAPVPATPAGE